MVIRLTTVKSQLWFCAVLLLVFSFPIQVYARSPYPSLAPYLFIGLITFLTLLFPTRKRVLRGVTFRQNGAFKLMIGVYLFLLLLNTAWQFGFGVISLYEAMTALVLYLLPTYWYWYFRTAASEKEIRWVLVAMGVAGLISGLYFAYDSYVKQGLGEVTGYAIQAFQYSVARGDLSAQDISGSRIASNFRSYGLLETHAVSGAWAVLGAFATLGGTQNEQDRRYQEKSM